MLRDPLRRSRWIALLFALCCDVSDDAPRALLAATPGTSRFEEPGLVAVPGGLVNAAGGNLLVRRVDLSIDTKLGTWEIGAAYNSKTRGWLWSFETSFDGSTFVDPSGAVHADLWYLADGDLVPGSVWIKHDASRIRSVGGLVHEFDETGRLSVVRWASGPYPRLEHVAQPIAGAPRTTEIRQCGAPGSCAPVAALSYDASGRVAAIVDRAGRVADFAYDASGRLVAARDALDVERSRPGARYEYRDDGLLRAATSSDGERLEYAWHPRQARVTEVRGIGAEGFAHRFEYAIDPDPEAPHACAHVDPLGQRTLYHFDRRRRLRRRTLPTGEMTALDWTGLEVARLVSPGGATTTWEYPGPDAVVRTDPSGNAVRRTFRIGGGEDRTRPFQRPVERIEDSLGPIARRGYDWQGRLVWVENGAGERTSFEWGADNLLARRTGPDGIPIAMSARGEHGHAERIEVGGEIATRVFDAVGNLVATTGLEKLDPRPGGELARRFDADRNLAEIELEADGSGGVATVRIEWRSDRRPLRIERPGGNDHEFEYDALGRLVARSERTGGALRTTLYEVDALGRMLAETLPNGMRREWSFDAAGRPAGLAARRDGALEGELSVLWADDRPLAVADSLAGGSERLEWTAAGELAAIAFPGGERLEIARDLRGRRVRETYRMADGSVLREIGFGYDAAGREARIDADGALVALRQWSQGRLASEQLGNGLLRQHDYDPATGLATGSTTLGPGGAVVEATSLSVLRLDPPGELRLVAETTSAGPATATTREEFALGPLGGAGKRLVAWSDGVAERPSATDARSNSLVLGDDFLAYDAESSVPLLRVDAASGEPIGWYAWDAAGYCVSRDGVPLAWTALGRIAAIGADASFEWDLQGRPLRRRVAGDEARFLFGGRVEVDAAGMPRRLDLGVAELRLDTGERRYRLLDFRGNVKLESDDAGAVVRHLRYGPYGVEERLGDGDGAATFAGGREVAGLVLLGARVLDPAAGRFLAPDPVLQAVNQHAYTLGNPIAFWDPDGRQWRLSGFLYGTASGAGAVAIGAATAAASGSATVGAVIGGPIGAVLGLAIAEAVYQQLNPGSRGPFSLSDVLELGTPLYVAPPADRGDSCDCSARPAGGERSSRAAGFGAPSPDPSTPGGGAVAGSGAGSSGLRVGAWGAGTSGIAIGGGYGGGW